MLARNESGRKPVQLPKAFRQAASAVPTLSVQNVRKHYALGQDRVEVLRGVDLALESGEVVAVMGPSGVGKSTLLNCIAGLDVPDEGHIEIRGQSLEGMSDANRTLLRRDNIGIVFQFFNLVSNLSARENVILPFLIEGRSPDEAEVSRALERVGMLERQAHLPSQLSGGEMQLVSIARAIVKKPGLLLADEPTGNVNVETGRRVMQLLKDVSREVGSSLLMVTHNPADAAQADRVLFMKDGRIHHEASLGPGTVSRGAVDERLTALGI